MRIVEPVSYDHAKPVRRSRKRPFLIGVGMVLFILAGAGGYWFFVHPSTTESVATREQTDVVDHAPEQPQEVASDTTVEPAGPPPPSPAPVRTMRNFAPNDFKLFYDQLQQPDLVPVQNPPSISGNVDADARIRIIAESRGYRLRSSPSVTLGSVDGYPVQAPVGPDWLALKSAAQAEGLSISIVSSFRSVEHQRSLFLSRLAATGATIEQVAAGQADDKVNYVLVTSSIPGYSKHHTGYTLDILCAGWQFENFKNSPCNAWISADNFKVAKEHGFIPSYPPGADAQGPDPEAWEFVWVGRDLLYEQR